MEFNEIILSTKTMIEMEKYLTHRQIGNVMTALVGSMCQGIDPRLNTRVENEMFYKIHNEAIGRHVRYEILKRSIDTQNKNKSKN